MIRIPIALAAATLLAVPLAAAPPKKPAAATGTSAASPIGDVTRAQMQAEAKRVFDMADVDKDGAMSAAEFGKRMAAVLNRAPPGSKGAPTKKQAQALLNAARAAFNKVDSNGDGKLSLAEASRRPLAAFDMMDADRDGILTVAEKAAARASARPAPAIIAKP